MAAFICCLVGSKRNIVIAFYKFEIKNETDDIESYQWLNIKHYISANTWLRSVLQRWTYSKVTPNQLKCNYFMECTVSQTILEAMSLL